MLTRKNANLTLPNFLAARRHISMNLDAVIDSLHVVALPLHQEFRNVTYREIAIFQNQFGWGEFSAFLEYDDNESARWLRAGLECASKPFPKQHREKVDINATIPAVKPKDALAALARFEGCGTVKIKVAHPQQSFQEDLDRIIAIHREFSGKIRLDANGGWSLSEAAKHINQIQELIGEAFEYVEQPVNSFQDLTKIRQQVSVPIAVDEGIRKAGRISHLDEIADIAILKVAPMGGVYQALAIAHEIDLPVVVSSALDSSIGIRAGLALALAVPNLYGACGLGTIDLMSADVTQNPLRAESGFMKERAIEVDSELLSRYAVDSNRYQWWRDRIERCWKLLEIEGELP